MGGPDMLRCRVLGPLEIEVDGEQVDLGGPLPRRLMSALLAAEGKPIADATLAELVWDSEPPAVLSSALQVTVSRLRSALGPTGRESLARSSAGYVFDVKPEQTDAGQFVAMVAAGGQLLSSGDAPRAAHAYGSALALWRGEPWSELGSTPVTTGARARLRELREIALEELQAARLASGDAAGAVAALSEAVAASPYRERRWELLVLGLYRCGRQGHALAELRRVRELLAEELGVDPGPALRALELQLLNHDPRLLIVDSPAPPAGFTPAWAPTSTDPTGAGPTSPGGEHRASASGEPAPLALAPSELAARAKVTRPVARPLSSFIGRQAELALLAGPLATRRLVSLLGPAGVGKTRLAMEHLAGAASQTDAWLVRLSEVATPQGVALSVASALGVARPAGDPVPAIERALADTPGLLVLDNCEHLVGAVGELAMALLASCPRLRILVTSREPLGVDGEHIVAVRPLAVTGDNDVDGAAVALLLDRVGASRPGWRPSAGELASARQICRALDGLPLAIELAASRERAFGLAGVASHLRDRFAVLGATPRGSLTPHATLRAAIEWSVDLLPSADRAMLLRLWPFEGGFSWQAAEAVQPPGAVGRPVLATLASLVDRSMVMADTATAPARYRLLETVRDYCRAADPDPSATRAAHAAWARSFVADQVALTTGPEAGQAFRSLTAELPNIRSGIAHDLDHHPVDALRTSAALEWLWSAAGSLAEGSRLIQDALRACPSAGPADRVNGLLALAIVTFHAGDPGETIRLADEAIAMLARSPDSGRPLLLKALRYRAAGTVQVADVASAWATAERLATELDRLPTPAWVHAATGLAVGAAQLMAGRRAEGEASLVAARDLSYRCGYLWGQGTGELLLAWNLLSDREVAERTAQQALRSLQRALAAFTEQSNGTDLLSVLYAGAHALPYLDRATDAIRLRAAVVEHAERFGADHRRYVHLAGAGFEARLDQAVSPGERAGAERDGRALSWPAMLQLFSETANAALPAVLAVGPEANPAMARPPT
ncbi:MAG TPA: BTAD domain-containing putative transcriptional regulator [Pseudonocardia sp.]|uniref:AfsR/SARP family transcriptional regulator n=1 Tax=Pseudonocardia sp. TaxID=60912 RepID=UPI002C957D05|nr:BTAD domain-containing putative transcriptional regulator [Pseudonocardia sp.]HTF52435.1 BTAD domain-containing putative transcriptional regulator [Pseudonocardia sp.]